MTDGLCGEELGAAALVATLQGIGQRRTALYPAVQVVQGHMGVAVGEVHHGQLALAVGADNKSFFIHWVFKGSYFIS